MPPAEIPNAQSTGPLSIGRILVVDDEPVVLRATARVLRAAGFEVMTATDGGEAVSALREQEIDAVLSDIFMPGTGGIELLRYVRTFSPDLPVVLITGEPAVETAIQALDHGAWKYLLKPVSNEILIDCTQKAVQMAQMARIRREAHAIGKADIDPELRQAFDAALASLWMAFQPIVSAADGSLHGHEALMRVKHERIPHPGAMLDAAERLDEVFHLGQTTRKLAAHPVIESPDCGALFVNLHPHDLRDDDLVDPGSPLAGIASRVVLEITERKSINNVEDLRRRIIELRDLGFRIAVDDLGAGYAGLTSFALLEPDIVKIDMALVRDIDSSPVKRHLVRSVTTLCKEMGILVVGEGVETIAERDALVDLGCDLLQGFLLAKPGKPFPDISW
jgi:EAL domain-containing protein (putative c-di-GMP-specific phosphodiesterase class I)